MSIFSINPDEVMASLFKINQASESALPEVGDVKPNGVHPNTDVGPATTFEFELANSATDIGMAIKAVQSLLAIEHGNEQVFLACEVVQHACATDARAFGETGDREVAEAVLGDHRLRFVHELRPATVCGQSDPHRFLHVLSPSHSWPRGVHLCRIRATHTSVGSSIRGLTALERGDTQWEPTTRWLKP